MQIDLYDDSSLDKSLKKNWVEKRGGLPGPMRARARAIKRKHPDWTLSHCIAVAINAVKYSAATGDSKLPGRQNQRASKVAAHAGAAARWEAMKGSKGKVSLANPADKEGSKASGVVSVDTLKKAKAAYKRKKSKMSPAQQKKVEARLKSSQQRLGQKVGLSTDLGDEFIALASATDKANDGTKSKEFPAKDFKNNAPKGKKCSRWGCDKPAVAEREVGGKKLGACAEHKKQMTKGQKVNMASKPDGPKGTDAKKHDKVFLKGRRTPEVVPKGASSKKNLPVKKRKPATAEDEKKISKGDWLREDSEGRKPGKSGYLEKNASKGPDAKKKRKKVNLAISALNRRRNEFSEDQYLSLANTLLNEANQLGISVDLAVSQASATQAATQPRQGGGRFGNRGGSPAVGGSNNSATSQKPQDFQSLVRKLKDGQSVTLPNTKSVKIKKVANGYQIFNGKENVLVKTVEDALSRAQAFGREEKGGKLRDNVSNPSK